MKYKTMQNSNQFPSVTVAIPTYNEAKNIAGVLEHFLSTQYPNLVEIFVADGGSTDGTQEIVQQFCQRESRVHLLHNPAKIQSAALNLILHHCTGEIFLRVDAHSEYALDYIERCVEILLTSNALNVGGATRFVARTAFQAGVSLAASSPLGNGGARHRDPNYNGYTDTVFPGCFWKRSLLQVGGYDCKSLVNEDAELNIRLAKHADELLRAGKQESKDLYPEIPTLWKAVYVSSQIKVWYYPRQTWRSLCTQYFKYGRGRFLTSVRHPQRSRLRSRLPFLVISTILVGLFIDLLFPALQLPVQEVIYCGLLIIFLEGGRITWQLRKTFSSKIWRGHQQNIPSYLSRWFFCSITLLTMPTAHFSGYGYQLLRYVLLGKKEW